MAKTRAEQNETDTTGTKHGQTKTQRSVSLYGLKPEMDISEAP